VVGGVGLEYVTERVLFISLFIMIIHCIDTTAYATRLSGARVGYLASAFSLFNVMVIVSRMSNMIQQPLTGSLVDIASDLPYIDALMLVENQYRFIIGACTVGTVLGILFFPTFISLFSRALFHLSLERGSIIRLLRKCLSVSYIVRACKHITFPRLSYLKGIKFKHISFSLLITNTLITAIYTVGVLSSLFAALLIPQHASTAIMASGLINGVATILIFVLVDPKVAILADEVSNQKGSYAQLKTVTLTMIVSRLLGTILAQIIFVPAAYYVAWFTKFLL
jgi:Alternate to MurJ